jgi:hypothetical protein
MPNPIRSFLRTFVKPITIRLRYYFQADVLAELTALRAQLGTPGHNLDSLVHSVENALLTLAVLGDERQQGQGGFAPLDPPLRAEPLEPAPGQ